MRRFAVSGFTLLAVALGATPAHAIPAWARKYHMNCSGCHYPAPPRLNATGIRFRWAGYRMPNEIGRGVTAEDVSNYIAANGAVVFNVSSMQGQGITEATVDAGEGTLFYGGPFGDHYLGWFEFSREDGEFMLVAQMGGVWGNENRYGGFKIGQGHWFYESGLGGFDRTVGLSGPLPLQEPLTAASPFVFAEDRAGGEGFLVTGRNRISVSVFDRLPGMSGEVGTRKDFMVSEQMMLDNRGSGLQVSGYFGNVSGVDTTAPALRSDYWRVAATATKRLGVVELGGGVVYGKDNNLPTGVGSAFAVDHVTGMGWWLSGQWAVARRGLSLYGRYESADPNTDAADDATRRVVLGGVIPLTLPEYLRLTAEYQVRMPQVGPKLQSLGTGLVLSF